MTARTRSFVLLAFAIVLLRLGASDLLLRYLRPAARPYVLAAGAVIAVVAACSLAARGHRERGSSPLTWLALAPVAAVLVIGPPALGSFTADRQPLAPTRPGQPFAALPGLGVVPMTVVEFALRALDRDGATLAGRAVAMTGFVARPAAGGFVLARLIITCCAADARPVEVLVRARLPSPTVDEWVRVTGRFGGEHADVPVLTASAVTPAAVPTDPYDR